MMLDQLKPVARQLDETYEALHISLGTLADEQLGWSPGGDTKTVAVIAQHIAAANMCYASVIRAAEDTRDWDYELVPTRPTLLARIDQSQRFAHETLEGITAEDIHISRSDDWNPNCNEQVVQAPLDALWFAMQMVRHTAYHLGQINLYLRMLGV